MKSYISGIEKILQTELEINEVENFEFNDETLIKLAGFSNNYNPCFDSIPQNNQLICFASFPELIDFSFNTYKGNGTLEDHWFEDNIMAHLLLFNDRVLLYDHLENYAKSAIDGYTVGHRYDGLKNWLTKLAEWKPFIVQNELCIVPKNLTYSPAVKKIWDDGLGDISTRILCEFDDVARGEIEDGFINDCLFEINKISYLIASCSIYRDSFNELIPFLKSADQLEYLNTVLKSFLKISSEIYQPAHEPGKTGISEKQFSGVIQISSPLNRGLLQSKNLIRQVRNSKEINEIRAGIRKIRNEILDTDPLSKNIEMISKLIAEKEKEWNLYYERSNKNPLTTSFNFNSATLHGITSDMDSFEHQVSKTIFQAFNNAGEKNEESDSLLNYSMGIF